MKKILTLLLIIIVLSLSSICFAETESLPDPEEISFESELSLEELEGKSLAEKIDILKLSRDDINAITFTKITSESIKEDYVSLTKKEVPTEIEKDGKKYKIISGSEKWSETKRDAAVATRRILQIQRPDFPGTITDSVEFPKGKTQTVTLQLSSVTQDKNYVTIIEAPVTCFGSELVEDYYLDDVLMTSADAPAISGYEDDIFAYLGLNDYKESCKITGSRWISEFRDGKRDGIYTVQLTGGAWDATYVEDLTSAELVAVYDAEATYEPALSRYIARVSYKAIENQEPVEPEGESSPLIKNLVIIGAGILIIALAIATIIYFVKKKKTTN